MVTGRRKRDETVVFRGEMHILGVNGRRDLEAGGVEKGQIGGDERVRKVRRRQKKKVCAMQTFRKGFVLES